MRTTALYVLLALSVPASALAQGTAPEPDPEGLPDRVTLDVQVERTGGNEHQTITVRALVAPLDLGASRPEEVARTVLPAREESGGRDSAMLENVPVGRVVLIVTRDGGPSGVGVLHLQPGRGTITVLLHPGPAGALELAMPRDGSPASRCLLSPGRSADGVDEVPCEDGTIEDVPRGHHELVILHVDGTRSVHPLYVDILSVCSYRLTSQDSPEELGCREPVEETFNEDEAPEWGEGDIGCDPVAVEDHRLWPGFRMGLSMLLGAQWAEVGVDHAAIGAALGADYVLSEAFLLGARIGYLTGGDRGVDADGDFEDDDDSDNTHLLLASAGPRLRLGENDYRTALTALELDLGAGALTDLADVAPSGMFLEGGVRLLRAATHLGIRYAQGVGDVSEFRSFVAEAGFRVGGMPERNWVSNGCNAPIGGARDGGLAHGFRAELLVASWGLGERGGLGPPGIALQLALPLLWRLSFAARADAIYYPGFPGDGVVQYGASGGLRLAMPLGEERLHVSLLGGYAVSYGTQPAPFDSGPFMDAGVSYGFLNAGQVGLHLGIRARFGLAAANEQLRALFLTLALDYDGTTT